MAGLEVPDDALASLTASGLDRVYDAAATAWTTRRVERGESVSLSDPPEVFLDRQRDLGVGGRGASTASAEPIAREPEADVS